MNATKPTAKTDKSKRKNAPEGKKGGKKRRANFQQRKPKQFPKEMPSHYDTNEFEDLVTIYPYKRLRLEHDGEVSTRVIDMVAPIGKGQRALIVSPPRAGKTYLLKTLAKAICKNNPETEVFILLVDERPEEVTDIVRSGYGEVVMSSFDKPDSHHVETAEKLLERARKIVLEGKDVVILLDSITRLARAYNSWQPGSGKMLSGGMDAKAMYKPKKFFGAARAIENGGSLTIIGTALVDTGSRMDELIFEEFKGTGNMELHLDRRLMEKRVFPTIDINKSGSRKEELLMNETELEAARLIRKKLFPLDNIAAMETLLSWITRTKTNAELVDSIAGTRRK